jgi:hypothetical protein
VAVDPAALDAEPMSVDNVEPAFFELELTSLEPLCPTRERRIKTIKGLDRELAQVQSAAQLVVGLTAFDADECDMGSFWLFLNGARAWIHLTEGACFTARAPGAAGRSRATVEFQDDGGTRHRIPLRDTVSRDQGLEALRRWLPHGEKWPGLRWVRA